MPTGYTAKLEKDWDVKRWLLQDISRAFGMCIMLREDSFDMSEEAIKDHLKEQMDSNYHTKRIIETRLELEECKGLGDKGWRKRFNTASAEGKRKFEAQKEKQERAKEYYDKSLNTLYVFRDSYVNTEHEEKVKYAIKQLELVESEFEPPDPEYYLLERDSTWEDYKKANIELLERDLDYHIKKEDEDRDRAIERYVHFMSWKKQVETFFGGHESERVTNDI